MDTILEAIQAGASGDDIANVPIPDHYRAAFVHRDDVAMFEGVESADKDPRKSLHVGDVATPELAPDEVYLAVMASSINFNTVWTSIFEPLPTFGFLDRLGRESDVGRPPRPAVPRRRLRRVGRRAAGRVGGAQLEAGRPGHRALQLRRRPGPVGPRRLDARRQPADLGLRDELRRPRRPRRVVKANQLMPKPTHLTWEEAAVNALCNSTSYRMLVGDHGARMKQGDSVLVWGATGGIGGYAVQYVLNGGGTPVGVVSSPERAELLNAHGLSRP